MYNYDSRYYLTASIRADGSSRFPKGNKFGYFPSVSLAWRLSNEKFMEATQGWLSNAKIRLGWGRVGNQAIANGAYMTKLNNGVNYVFGPDGTRYPATILGDMGNPNLKWETVGDSGRQWKTSTSESTWDSMDGCHHAEHRQDARPRLGTRHQLERPRG